MKYIKRGRNDKYPNKIEVWKLEDPNVPSWLSDISKIASITNGNVQIDYRKTNTGGIEILDSSGTAVILRLDSEDFLVCKDLSTEFGGIIALSPKQVELLYIEDGKV